MVKKVRKKTMAPNLRFLKQLSFFNFEKNSISAQELPIEQPANHIGQHVDIDKVETLICLESLIVVCYQSLAWLVHNRTVRHECQQFEQHAQNHQEELRKIFPLFHKSEVAIEIKVNQHLLQLKPSYLSLREVINLAINLTVLKTDIYKYFFHTAQGHHELLNSLLEDNAEEMYFLRQERNFHQNRLNTFLKV